MNLKIKNMNEKYAIEVLCWKYEKPYDFYNTVLTSSAILELVTYDYYVVFHSDEIIGYFCLGIPAQVPEGESLGVYKEDCIDVGIGMKPEWTGKGYGSKFFSLILSFVKEKHEEKSIRLTVATFNKRAIHLYEKFGFTEKERFIRKDVEYMTMIKKAEQ